MIGKLVAISSAQEVDDFKLHIMQLDIDLTGVGSADDNSFGYDLK